jgi:hypothetical protein
MPTAQLHEDLARAEETTGPSNRKFGLTIAVVFALLTALALYRWSPWAVLWAALGALMAAAALWRPDALSGLNRAWLRFGLVLHRIVNPVVMAFLFYVTILPIGLILRLFGKDILHLRWDEKAGSYWIKRADPRPLSESMRQQF